MNLVGSNLAAQAIALDELPGKVNYFIGDDPKKWRTDVSTYAKAKYEDVYPGVALVYYGNQGKLEYDFVVAPGADPNVIAMRLEIGNSKIQTGRSKIENPESEIRVDANGDLVIQAKGGELRFHKPLVYQPGATADSKSIIQNSKFLVAGNRVRFEIPSYDRSRPLVIDPVLDYSTYLGGSGGDVALGIAVDSSNNAYVTGATGSTNFPITSAEQTTLGGSTNAFITKFDATGALVYSTYLGGSGSDAGNGIAVDDSGNVTIVGNTTSVNFPTTSSAFQAVYGGLGDAFVARLGAAGTTLVYSTYLGGSAADFGQGIALDGSGNAYVTGSTASNNFPIANALQIGLNGPSDAFVTKLNPTGTGLIYSTYLGGAGGDSSQGIAVDTSGNAYVAGLTASTDFPTQSAYQSTSGGGTDAFVTEFSSDGSKLVFSTYLGGSGQDRAFGIALDASGGIYVAGDTQSVNFPVSSGAFQILNSGGGDAFVSKLAPGGGLLAYSTFLGGTGSDQATAVAVTGAGETVVTGITQSSNFPLVDPFQKIPGLSGAGTCGLALCSDAFVGLLDASGTPLYTSYLGGSGNDFGQAAAVDSSGAVYVSGGTASGNFPVIAGAAQGSYAGIGTSGNAFVVKISNVDSPAVALTPQEINFGSQALNIPSNAQTVLLVNEGSANLDITSIPKTAGPFSQVNNCGTAVPGGGGTCAIQISFTPTAPGFISDQLAITDNAGGSPQVLTLTGTGTYPTSAVTTTPSSLTFPPTVVNSTTAAQIVQVANTGQVALQITSVLATSEFTETNNCGTLPVTLNVGSSCNISVTMTPTKTGALNGTLTIADSTGKSHSVTLSGTGTPQFTLSSSATSNVLLIGTTSTTFTIAAAAPSTFSSTIRLTCASLSGGAACGFFPDSINPGQTSLLTVNSLSATSPNPLNFTVTGTAAGQTASVTLNIFFSDFSMNTKLPTPLHNTVSAGQTANYTITATPINGFNQVVLLSCGPVPQAATCTFTPPSVLLNGAAGATTTLSITTTTQTPPAGLWRVGNQRKPGPGPGGIWLLWVVVGWLALSLLGKPPSIKTGRRGWKTRLRPRWSLVACAVLLSWLLLALGCQQYYNGLNVTPAPVGTPTGNYTIFINGTMGSNSAIVRSTLVNLGVGPG